MADDIKREIERETKLQILETEPSSATSGPGKLIVGKSGTERRLYINIGGKMYYVTLTEA